MPSNKKLTPITLKKLIAEFEHRWVWKKLSANKNLPFCIDALERFQDRWSWNLISQNEKIAWNFELLEKFKSQLSWNWVAKNEAVPWSDEIFNSFSELIRWDILSSNKAVTWTADLIQTHIHRWDWLSLNRNPALPWSANLIKKRNLSAAYTANMLSAVNSVMSRAHSHNETKWTPVTGREVNLERRTRTRTNKTVTREQSSKAIEQLSPRTAAIANLARELGLRSKEASLINAKKSLADATNNGFVAIEAGTKGGRYREVPIVHSRQIEALKNAAEMQADHHSLVPPEQTWAQFREGELRHGREQLKSNGVAGYHQLRAAYATERYADLTGHHAPVNK